MDSFIVNIILASALGIGVSYSVVRWAFQKDTKIEERRRNAAKLAGVLSRLGLKHTPAFLIDYSVGDYSGMAHRIGELTRLFLEGEEAVLAEFSQVFDSVLKAKLKTEAGRAYIAAKLVDAAESDDVSIVGLAPRPTTK